MVLIEEYRLIRQHFLTYVADFKSTDIDCQEFYDVKLNHSLRVSADVYRIAKELKLNQEDLILAKIIGLVHDIGRFEQYRKYRTFNDEESVSHSLLGIEILKEINLLKEISNSNKEILYTAIRNHNVYKIEKNLDSRSLLFSKLLRDADKLDIYKLTIEDERVSRMYPDDKKDFQISEEVFNSFLNHTNVRVENAVTLYDFILLRLSWVFDFNFPATRQLIEKRQYIQKLINLIPHSERKVKISELVIQFADDKLIFH